MKIRQGKDIILRWKITTNGEALPLEGRNLTLILSTPNGRERVLSYTTEDDIIGTRLPGKEITHLGDYTLTLWENRGEQGQTAVDAVNAFEIVKYTTMEGDGSPCGSLEAEVLNLSGELGVFQQGTTAEKNKQVDMNTEDIAELQQDMKDVQGVVAALENADASLRGEIANVKDKNAEQDEEMASLLNILGGKLDIKDLGSELRPDQAVSEIINYVRSNNIKSALVFKYIDTDNSSTFGICISRTGTSGWIIYLVARKGVEVLKFNSRGYRETWNEYGGVLRHDMNSVADEQLECLSIKGIKSVLDMKQDTLISGQNIKTINGESIMGEGDIVISGGGGGTSTDLTEVNQRLDDLEQQTLTLSVKDNGNIVIGNIQGQTKEFMPATPSGDPMHYAYVSAGAEYNATDEDIAKTGVYGDTIIHKAKHWYLNEVGDIDNREMGEIYRSAWFQNCSPTSMYFSRDTTRVPLSFSFKGSDGLNGRYLYYYNNKVDKIRLSNYISQYNFPISISDMTAMFIGSSVRHIIDPMRLHSLTAATAGVAFDGCTKLEELRIELLKVSISLKYSPLLSKSSIIYAINNCSPTTSITITLHPDAYARMANDEEVIQALNTKNEALSASGGSIGLVSA